MEMFMESGFLFFLMAGFTGQAIKTNKSEPPEV